MTGGGVAAEGCYYGIDGTTACDIEKGDVFDHHVSYGRSERGEMVPRVGDEAGGDRGGSSRAGEIGIAGKPILHATPRPLEKLAD